MADDVKPEVIKRTQELLGKYFKKPPLTEKLLRKPPFRFLHDIVSAVTRETGFLDGLFADELNSEYINNKEAKLAYLTKLIEVVKLATGANLTVRASKIISGQEPTKTNELLQAIGMALDKKISSAEAVEHYRKNLEKGKSTLKSKSSARKEEKVTSSKDVQQKRVATGRDKSSSQRRRMPNEAKSTPNNMETHNESRELKKNVDVTQNSGAELTKDKIPSSANKKRSSSDKPKPSTSSAISSEAASIQENVNTEKKVDENKKQKEVENKSRQTTYSENNDSINNKINENIESLKIEHKEIEETTNEITNQNEEKTDHLMSENQKSQLENINISIPQSSARPRTSLRPPIARPISARPAAPRLRAKPELSLNEEILTPMGTISVIVENAETKEDDDAEDMVVLESRGGGSGDSLENTATFKVDDQLTQEHGHLVAQILETQKELVNNENVDVIPKKTNISWDTSSKRDIIVKEVDKLRNTIQTLTRATNPLGKLLDYFQEDVEIMQKELFDWRSQYQQVNEQLKTEKM